MKIIPFHFIIVFFLLFTCFELSAKKALGAITLDEAKAHYLVKVIKHVEQKAEIDPIIIGFLRKKEHFLIRLGNKCSYKT